VKINPQHGRPRNQHPRGVEGGHERKVSAGGVCEPSHRTGGIAGGSLCASEHRAAGADADQYVALPGPRTECGRHVVARSRSNDHPRGGHADTFTRGAYAGNLQRPPETQFKQIWAPAILRSGEIPRSRGVPAVGHRLGRPAEQMPRQPIMGQQHTAGRCGGFRLCTGGPAQLGHSQARDRDGPHLARPRQRPTELLNEICCGARGAGVVPQQRRTHRLTVTIQQHHAVLLTRDRDRPHPGQQVARRTVQRVQPALWVNLSALRVPGRRLADYLPRVGVDDEHLCGLGRGINSGDERHACRTYQRAVHCRAPQTALILG